MAGKYDPDGRETRPSAIVNEIISESKNKDITRFISTHPDEDHIHGLKYLDEKIHILNFYCVENQATKKDKTEDFKHYCALRDGEYHYYVYKGCKRKWMNEDDDEKKYGSSGINFLWPQTDNQFYLDALDAAKAGDAFNNLSPIFSVCSTKPLPKSRTTLDTRGERLRCFEFDEMDGI